MPGGCFHTLSLAQFLGIVDDLHTRVANGHGRVEITRDDCDDVCILISKAELESLERALEILSETPDFQRMCESVMSVVASAGPVTQLL
jgi:PHD/YefM family antitoxin component YafN of YafNO toxin-antitoxin module